MHAKWCEFSWLKDKKEMTITNWGALRYNFVAFGLSYKVTQNFRVSLNEKKKSYLKWIKSKVLQVIDFLLFACFFLICRELFLSTLVTLNKLTLDYISIRNNLKLIKTFLTTKPLYIPLRRKSVCILFISL